MYTVSTLSDLHKQLREINRKIRREISCDVVDFQEVRRLIQLKNKKKKLIQ